MAAPDTPIAAASSGSWNPISVAVRAIGSCCCFFRQQHPPPAINKPLPADTFQDYFKSTTGAAATTESSVNSKHTRTYPPSTYTTGAAAGAMVSSSSSSSSARSMYGSPHGSSKRRSSRRGGVSSSSSSSSSSSRDLVIAAAAEAAVGSMRFNMVEIHRATDNFSPTLRIGRGGFGTVYRATLHNGMVVAVKRAKKSDDHDNRLGAEFQSEIQMLSRIEHPNLVRFLGYLEHQDERIVVVEYVPNGTLREHLNGLHGSYLDLAARLDIAIDVAHAVTYLHMYAGHPIIHRDIKSSNILLTENLRAKVADFGLARLGAAETGVTHVLTQVKGTAGYLDPEYLKTCQLTEKSDVYSFGVLLVELISGRRPIEPRRESKERITPTWAMKKFVDGSAVQVLDPNILQSPAVNLAMEKILELAFQCLAPTKQGRPSMRRCAEILWSVRKDYREQLHLSSDNSLSHSAHQNN